MPGIGEIHVGRSWSGCKIEDECPCPQESCGLVNLALASPDCEHHWAENGKTLRQIHQAKACPKMRL